MQRPSARRERRRTARPLIWQANDIADDPHIESSGTRVTSDCRAPVRSSGPVRLPIRRRDRSALGPRGVPPRHPRTLLGVARDPASRCGWGRCRAVLNRQWERAASRLRLSAGSVRTRHGRRFVVVALTAAIGGLAVSDARPASAPSAHYSREGRPQTAWAACNRNARNKQPSTFTPLSDAKAAALVTPEPETRPYNARPYTILGKRYPAANDYVPTAAQIRRYRDSRTSSGQALLKFNPYTRYVDGRDGMRHPSTDDLIQWAAHKWGIPENWLRAEYVVESYWNHFNLGDDTKVSSRWYPLYPYQSRIPHTSNVYQSLGITQVRWAPDGSLGAAPNHCAGNRPRSTSTSRPRRYASTTTIPAVPGLLGATGPTLRVKRGRASGDGTTRIRGATRGRQATSRRSVATSTLAIGPLPASWIGPLPRCRAGYVSDRRLHAVHNREGLLRADPAHSSLTVGHRRILSAAAIPGIAPPTDSQSPAKS